MNIHDYRTVTIRSLSYGNRKVILHIEKQRYVCPVCNKRTTSSIDIVDRNCSISNEVKDEIRRKLFGVSTLLYGIKKFDNLKKLIQFIIS